MNNKNFFKLAIPSSCACEKRDKQRSWTVFMKAKGCIQGVIKRSLWKKKGAFRVCSREAYGEQKEHLCLTGDYVEEVNWNAQRRERIERQGNQVLHRNESRVSRH